MRLTFTKRGGKHDDLAINREGQTIETIRCPKQGIIPHDMIHYAVESSLAHRGFFTLIAEGKGAGYATKGGDSEEAIERLVETFQAEMWGGRVPAAELLATYEHACGARGHGAVPISPADVEAVRARLDELTERWSKVPLNGSLTLKLRGA
ncbi:MAG: hypothetical protein JO013_12120 [Alphaproteobacteria bacterium]|nr:hypothetical protein [Alphaproteobacteria bacterium]